MKIKLGLLTALFIGFSSVGFAQATKGSTAPASNRTSGIRSVDFLNYSYQSSVCSEDLGIARTIKVRKGKFKNGDNFFNIDGDEVVYGDVNGDGREDVVVPIRCGNSVGTHRAFEIHAYTFQNNRAKLLARLDSNGMEGDYQKAYPDGTVFFLGENAAKIKSGQLIVEALTDGSFASPENIATFNYKLSGAKLVLNGKPTKRLRE